MKPRRVCKNNQNGKEKNVHKHRRRILGKRTIFFKKSLILTIFRDSFFAGGTEEFLLWWTQSVRNETHRGNPVPRLTRVLWGVQTGGGVIPLSHRKRFGSRSAFAVGFYWKRHRTKAHGTTFKTNSLTNDWSLKLRFRVPWNRHRVRSSVIVRRTRRVAFATFLRPFKFSTVAE